MKKGSSYKVKQWANRQKIAGRMRSVLNVLADFANGEGICWPSQETIAERTGFCVRSVRSELARLEYFGVIKRQRRSKEKGRRDSDIIILAVHRDFEITKADVKAAGVQPARNAGSQKKSNRQNTQSQPARRAGELPRELPDISLASRVTDIGVEEGIPVISEGRVLH